MEVIAIRDADENGINIYGWGTMIGKVECPELGGLPNPKIVLENGDIVWGYQCWWCSREKFETEMQDGRPIVVVPLKED